MGPLNVSRPLIAGHFHLLQTTQPSAFLSPTKTGGLDDNPLQHSASVDQDMRLVLNHIARILAPKPAPRRVSPLASVLAATAVAAALLGGALQAQAQSKPKPTPKAQARKTVRAKRTSTATRRARWWPAGAAARHRM